MTEETDIRIITDTNGMQFALPVSFIGMLVPSLRSRSLLLSALTAGAAALVFAGLPYNLGLISAALLGVLVGVVSARWDAPLHAPAQAQEGSA